LEGLFKEKYFKKNVILEGYANNVFSAFRENED
jgi:hypothetical protein